MQRERAPAPEQAAPEPAAPVRSAAAPALALTSPAAVLQAQRGMGNAAVSRLLMRDKALDGEPSDVKPDGKATGTASSLPQMADTAGPLDREDTTPVKHIFPAVLMKPKATAAAPLVTSSATFPGWDALVERRPATGPAADGFVSVSRADQKVAELKMTDGLYIQGSPRADDVEQGMVGDCWNLAVVAAIAARDPGKIMSIIGKTATGITATFLRRTTKVEYGFPPSLKTVYEPVHVSTSGELPFTVDEAGRKTATVNGVRQIHGAALRHGAHPVDKRWWVELTPEQAIVHSRATYEVARWSPLLEKAFAMFAAEYGQYGGTGAPGEKSGKDGYGAIEGGHGKSLYSVFYGEQGDITRHPENVPAVATAFTPGTNVLVDNAGIIRQLLPLQGIPDQAKPGETAKVPLVTASTSDELILKRLAQAIDFLVGFEEYEKAISEGTRGRIAELRRCLQERADYWIPPTSKLGGWIDRKQKSDHKIGAAARAVGGKEGGDLLTARSHERMGTAARNVVDLTLDAMNLGADSGGAQRNIYGDHAYVVVSARFADAAGAPVTLPPTLPTERDQLLKTLAPVSQEKSTVRLRNPHHGNEPDEQGTGAAARPDNGPGDDGLFNLNLTQFMLNVSEVSSFNAPHS